MYLFIIIPVLLAVGVDTVAAFWARGMGRHQTPSTPVEDFTVLIPIYGNTRYLENVEYLSQYGSRVTLVATQGETPEFYESLNAIAREHGFNVYLSPSTVTANAGRRATSGTIRDRIIRDALRLVRTPWVVMLDADSTTVRPFGELFGEMAADDHDVTSVKLVIRDEPGWLVRLQAHEYRLAMRLRFLAPWLVSGACHAGRTEAMRNVMNRHSLFFQGNDVELGVLAKGLGYTVGHVPFEVLTSAPASVKPWLRQRLAWAGGEFRLFIPNIMWVFRHPFFWLYGAVLMFATFPLRWLSVGHPGIPLGGAFALYYVLILWLHWEHRDRWILLMPFYTLFSSLVLNPIGVVSYAWMAIKHRNVGIIRLRRKPVTQVA